MWSFKILTVRFTSLEQNLKNLILNQYLNVELFCPRKVVRHSDQSISTFSRFRLWWVILIVDTLRSPEPEFKKVLLEWVFGYHKISIHLLHTPFNLQNCFRPVLLNSWHLCLNTYVRVKYMQSLSKLKLKQRWQQKWQ